MIQINLLPVREARRRADLRNWLLALGISAVSVLVICVSGHQLLRLDLKETRSDIAAAEQQLKAFEAQRQQIEEYKARKAEIVRKLDVITRLERGRAGPVRMLEELSHRIPERVWLTELSSADGQLNLKGSSLDNELVARFLTALEASPYLNGVDLVGTELQQIGDLKVNIFTVEAQLQDPAVAAPAATADEPQSG